MTANAFAEDRAMALAAGMNDHIPKPVDPTLLAQTLSRWLPHALQTEERADTLPPAPSPTLKPELDATLLRQRLHLVEGLQVEAGLRSMRGNLQRLRTYLLRFATEHGQDLQALQGELQQGEHEAAQRRLHTLKGLGGMLGLERVQRLAQAAEQQLRNPPQAPPGQDLADAQAVLQALHQALDESCLSILQRLGADAPRPEAETSTPAEQSLAPLAEPLARWRAELASDKLDAADTFETLRPRLQALAPQFTAELARAVDAFDFSRALALLDTHRPL